MTRRHGGSGAAACAALTCVLSALALAQNPPPPPPPPPPASAGAASRDMPVRAPEGGASLSGIVTSAGASTTPLAGVTVTLTVTGYQAGWTYVTDRDGRFAFSRLPAGRYALSASRPGRPTMKYGASRPGRTGASIPLEDASHLTDIRIAMPAGAVLSGRVTDESGLPVPFARVTVWPTVTRNGARAAGPFAGSAMTDDRGVYRVHSLAEGDYILAVDPRTIFGPQAKLLRYSAADIDAALRSASSPAAGAATTPALPDGEEVGRAAVYYPSADSAQTAAPVHLAAGEERLDLDIVARYNVATTLTGTLLMPDGTAPKSVVMTLVQTGVGGSTRPFVHPSPVDGSFKYTGLAPGRYTITARAAGAANAAASAAAPSAQDDSLWARADVEVAGAPVSGVRLVLQRPFHVQGTVAFEGDGAAPAPARITLTAVLAPGENSFGVYSATPDAAGALAIAGVTPGRYRVSAPPIRAGATQWIPASAMLNGQDVLDEPFEVRDGDVNGLVVTYTNRAARVTGTLEDASGRPAPDYYVILFPEDRRYWYPGSRWIKAVRPSEGGGYLMSGLSAGRYRIGAVIDVENNEWFEPSFLEQLLPASAAFTLSEGELRGFPLRIGGR